MHKKVLSVLASLFIATAPLGISSVYAVGEKIDNAFAFNYNVKDNSISSVLKIDGSVCIGGFEAVLNYGAEKYSVESTAKENADILMNVIPSKGEIVISMASNNNLVNTADLIRVEFVCSETPIASDFSFEITDAYMIDEICYVQKAKEGEFNIRLNNLPVSVDRLVFTVNIDGNGTMGMIIDCSFVVKQREISVLNMHLNGKDFSSEKAIILVEFYRKNGVWRFSAVARGFNGGLSELLKLYGGEEIKPDNTANQQAVNINNNVQDAQKVPAPKKQYCSLTIYTDFSCRILGLNAVSVKFSLARGKKK